jgi:hypothetical protein
MQRSLHDQAKSITKTISLVKEALASLATLPGLTGISFVPRDSTRESTSHDIVSEVAHRVTAPTGRANSTITIERPQTGGRASTPITSQTTAGSQIKKKSDQLTSSDLLS